MAEQDLLPQALGSFRPETISNLEELYGLRAEELFRGINPRLANRIYGPRTRISPQDAAELKVDLAKTYKDLAKVSRDGENASASDRVKLAIAAMNAGAKTEAAAITARGGIIRQEMLGEYRLALQSLQQADEALNALGPITSDGKKTVNDFQAILNAEGPLRQIPRTSLFDFSAAPPGVPENERSALNTAQDAAYNKFQQAITDNDDPNAAANITLEIANRNGVTPTIVKQFLLAEAGARNDNNVLQALTGDESTASMEALASYERSQEAALNAVRASAQRPGGSGAQSFLNVGLAAITPGPGGIQVSDETLRSLGVTAEQLQDPSAVNDITSAAQAQIENLFTAIDEGAAATPYMQEKIDAIKQSARVEGSAFREFLKESGLNPDSPAAVDVGFQLLEDEYAEVRKYETREAKMRAEAARRLRRQQRMNERQRGAEGELAAGTVQAGPDPMMPIDQELEMMEQQALQRQGQAAPAAEAPAAPDADEAELVQRGLILPGTQIVPLGKLEGDNTYEYAFDAATNEFIGYQPGQDPRTGNRFDLLATGLAQSNPRLFNSMRSTLQSKVSEVTGPAPEEAPAQDADPAVQREGIGVRRSQTENMQAIEKRLRKAAKDARARGNEESANRLEDEADRYLNLESGVTYREEEAQAQGVGTGFEQEEALPGDERFSIGAIPEDVPEERQTLEDLIPEDRIDPRPSPMEDVPPTAKDRMQEQLNAPTDGPLSTESQIGAIEQRLAQKREDYPRIEQEERDKQRAALLGSLRKPAEEQEKETELERRRKEQGDLPFSPRSPMVRGATQ